MPNYKIPCKYPRKKRPEVSITKSTLAFQISEMGTLLQLSIHGIAALSVPQKLNYNGTRSIHKLLKTPPTHSFRFTKTRAVSTAPVPGSGNTSEAEDPPSVDFAFVHSVLLPDGTPDVHLRTAPGGQKLRDIMLDSNIDLYGPYARPLLNCGGGGTCGTCMVEFTATLVLHEVVEGKELLNPRTDKEKEKLKRKPKNWRLACQTTVGKPDSRGLVVVQQLPEWKAHEWSYEKASPSEETEES